MSAVLERLRERILGEYLEMPDLRLTSAQMQRLGAVEAALCQTVLDTLVSEKLLRLSPNGVYSRSTDGPLPPKVRRE